MLTRHRQRKWYIPGVIVHKIGQDVYAVEAADNNIVYRDHRQLPPPAPDACEQAMTFEFPAGDPESDDDGEEHQYTAECILKIWGLPTLGAEIGQKVQKAHFWHQKMSKTSKICQKLSVCGLVT